MERESFIWIAFNRTWSVNVAAAEADAACAQRHDQLPLTALLCLVLQVDFFYHPRNVALVGATPRTMPPAAMHQRLQGFSWSMWLNVTSIQNLGWYQNVWQTTWRDLDRGMKLNNFSIGFSYNMSLRFIFDECTVYLPAQAALHRFQWQNLAFTMSEAARVKIYWNGILRLNQICGPPLRRNTNATLTRARMGATIGGTLQNWDE